MTTTVVNAGAVSQRAQGVLDVGRDALDPWQSALIADRFGGLGDTSGRQQCLPARLVRLHATPDVLGRLHLEMRLQLVAEVVVRAMSGEESGDARERGTEVSHVRLPSRREKGGDQIGGLVPFARFARELLPPRGGERIELRAAIVLGLAPLGRDESLLLELEQGGVERAVVERQAVLARFLDAARDAVAVQGPEDLEGLEDHQGEGALLHVELLRHVPSYGFPIRR